MGEETTGEQQTYLCKALHLTLALLPFPRHEHELVLQLPQVLQRVAAHVPTLLVFLWNLQLQGCVKTQLNVKKKQQQL